MAKDQAPPTIRDLFQKFQVRTERITGVRPSLERLANMTGLGRATVYRLLAGSHRPHQQTVYQLATVLGMAYSAVEAAAEESRTRWMRARARKPKASASPRQSRR